MQTFLPCTLPDTVAEEGRADRDSFDLTQFCVRRVDAIQLGVGSYAPVLPGHPEHTAKETGAFHMTQR